MDLASETFTKSTYLYGFRRVHFRLLLAKRGCFLYFGFSYALRLSTKALMFDGLEITSALSPEIATRVGASLMP